MSKKSNRKRIERLEAFARATRIEDAKRRHVESFAQMSGEEIASFTFALYQIREVQKEDPWKAFELFRSGLATTEYLDERGKLGWRAFCETGGQRATVEFSDAHEDKGRPRRPFLKGDLNALFYDVNLGSRRIKSLLFHRARLARQEPEEEEENKKDLFENGTSSRPKEESGGDDA